jgi:DNA ligase (NAD+)
MKTRDEFVNWLRARNEEYRNGKPTISDKNFDYVKENFESRFPDDPYLKEIGLKPSSRDEELPIKMFSLNKVKSIQELRKWMGNMVNLGVESFVITSKYDGISLLVNEINKFSWTRGDGITGQRSHEHYKGTYNYKNINFSSINIFTRGEALIKKEDFDEVFKNYDYKSARNTVAGLFNSDTISPLLKYVFVQKYHLENTLFPTKGLMLDFLNKHFNQVIIPYFVVENNISEDYINNIYEEFKKGDFEIDGLVIEVNSTKHQKGSESNNNPKWARAIKFPHWNKPVRTEVKEVIMEVSKQGKLKPVIQIKPVEVNGATISNVTGYNASYIVDNNIHEGAQIEIVRSGDVIPKHISTVTFHDEAVFEWLDEYSTCPCCGEQTKWDETDTELVCTNENCDGIKLAKLEHFFNVLGVEYFGEKEIKKAYDLGLKTPKDFLTEPFMVDLMKDIEGWKEKSYKRFMDQWRNINSKGLPAAKWLHAFDFFEGKLGEKTAQLIIDNVPDLADYSLEKLIEIEGVQEITAKAFINGLDKLDKSNLELFINISSIKTPKVKTTGEFTKSVCFTGFRDKELESKVVSGGGKVVSGVSKNTDILVVKDVDSTSSKMKKAQDIGIEILSKDDFINKYFKY